MDAIGFAGAQSVPTGHELLNDNIYNKGTAFTRKERRALKIDGLLPPIVTTIETQVERVMGNYRKKPTDIEKYIFLMALMERNLCRHSSASLPAGDHRCGFQQCLYFPRPGTGHHHHTDPSGNR